MVAQQQQQPRQHPLRAKRAPGPKSKDAVENTDAWLSEADQVLDLVERGVLKVIEPSPLPLPVDHNGKPKRRLTEEDERALAARIQANGDIAARNALVLANMGLVHMIANTFRSSGIRYEDLVAEGELGLMRATETFDPARKIRFSTYSVYWIRAKIQRFIQRLERDDKPSMAATAEMHTREDGRRVRPRSKVESMDAPLPGNEYGANPTTFGEMLADDSESQDEKAERDQVVRVVRHALEAICEEQGDPRLKTVVSKRLLAEEPVTLSQLGDMMNLSREGARLLETKLLKQAKLRLAQYVREPAGQAANE